MKAAATPPLSSPSYCSGHTLSTTSFGGPGSMPSLPVPRFGSSKRPTGPSSLDPSTRTLCHSKVKHTTSTAAPSPLSSAHGRPLRRVSASLRATSGSPRHSASPSFPTSSFNSFSSSPPSRNVAAALTGKEVGPADWPGPGGGSGYGGYGIVGASSDSSEVQVLLSDEELALVSFHIPVAYPTTDPRDVVAVPHIRRLLVPRDSPLVPHDNWGGGFVDDGDRCALNTMRLASVASAGATDMCVDLPDVTLDDHNTNTASSTTSSGTSWSLVHPTPPAPDGKAPSRHGFVGQLLHTFGKKGDSSSSSGGGGGGDAAGDGTQQQQQQSGGSHPSIQAPEEGEGDIGGMTTAPAERAPADAAAAAAAVAAAAAAMLGSDRGRKAGEEDQLQIVSAIADRVCVSLPAWAMRAGPRKQIFFDPRTVNAAIVTVGHICPGINDVVQGIVHRLTDYGVPEDQILGIPDGFKGFDSQNHPARPRPLTRAAVDGCHLLGGTVLGTSKSWGDLDNVVRKLEMWEINMLFVVGGDGGLRAAQYLSGQCRAKELPCCVVGVPKSIENDMLLVDRTFGFETAVQELQRPLLAAKVEASSIRGGIGLVKVMGRHSGFLAMQASLSSGVVDVCLIPEVSFRMDGPHGLLAYLEKVLARQGHAVLCVSEGAGQDLVMGTDYHTHVQQTKDAMGNPVLRDIGLYLRTRIKLHFKDQAEVRFIDPTYMIRTTPCNALDHIYARILAHNAVDAAFSGFTGVAVGMCNTHYVLLPIPLVTQAPRRVDPWGKAWNRLREDNGQPSFHPPPALDRAPTESTDTNGTNSSMTGSETATSSLSLDIAPEQEASGIVAGGHAAAAGAGAAAAPSPPLVWRPSAAAMGAAGVVDSSGGGGATPLPDAGMRPSGAAGGVAEAGVPMAMGGGAGGEAARHDPGRADAGSQGGGPVGKST